MTQPKDVLIKIGNVTLSTENLPKNGIDLTKLGQNTRTVLSIFDTNNDGKLSRAEINNAIMKFANADRAHTEQISEDITITTKRNGSLDMEELIELGELYPRKKPLSELGFESPYDTNLSPFELEDAAKALQKELVREDWIAKYGFARTYNEDWLKDAKGNHYRYNKNTQKFEKVDNVEYVAKDGSYRTRTKNDQGEQILITHNTDDNCDRIQVLNPENKAYIKPDYAAKVAGLHYENIEERYERLDIMSTDIESVFIAGYYDKNGEKCYRWDEKKHIFILVEKRRD